MIISNTTLKKIRFQAILRSCRASLLGPHDPYEAKPKTKSKKQNKKRREEEILPCKCKPTKAELRDTVDRGEEARTDTTWATGSDPTVALQELPTAIAIASKQWCCETRVEGELEMGEVSGRVCKDVLARRRSGYGM